MDVAGVSQWYIPRCDSYCEYMVYCSSIRKLWFFLPIVCWLRLLHEWKYNHVNTNLGKYHLPKHYYGSNIMVNQARCDGLQQTIEFLAKCGATSQIDDLQVLIRECQGEVQLPTSVKVDILPPIWIRGMNFAGAMLRWGASGLPRRTQAEIDERLAICRDCPHLVENHCNLCGCPCVESNQLLNKLALATESCPLGKWK